MIRIFLLDRAVMKKLTAVLIVLLCACATPDANRGPEVQERTAISFVDTHHQGKDKAFAAASAWALRTFPGKSAELSSDQASGMIVIKAAYKWVKATDPFQTHFQEGWVPYTLTVKIGGDSIGMDFLTGEAYGDIDASPAQARQELSPLYRTLRNSLVKELADKRGGF
jgi:hypothetical protein